nr:SEC-C domain-containing protein [uncultured Flavobacterium sp.]
MTTLKTIQLLCNKLGFFNIDLIDFIEKIVAYKKEVVASGNESEAKELWIFEQIVEIHKDYNEAFKLLKKRDYYNAWCKLEKIEISFHFLKKHFPFNKTQYKLYFIEKAIRNLQIIFPYRIFSSMEMVEKEKKCSVCGEILKLRSPCGHRPGEIYGGEICFREITDFEIIGIALVENPVNKYSVAFIKGSETEEQKDHYDYSTLDYLMRIINQPYQPWDLVVHNILLPHSNYFNVKEEDACPCGSGKNYQDCCLGQKGVKGLHYEFIYKIQMKQKSKTNVTRKKKRR